MGIEDCAVALILSNRGTVPKRDHMKVSGKPFATRRVNLNTDIDQRRSQMGILRTSITTVFLRKYWRLLAGLRFISFCGGTD